MGGLGPGIGGMEYIVIAFVALVVVGPERLPGLLHKVGKMMGKARRMANEFRASFDEMARQSELDELRKEVEALRTNQGMVALGAEAEKAFGEIRDDLGRPYDQTPPQPMAAVDEWPDSAPVMTPLEPVETSEPPAKPKRKAPAKPRAKAAAKPKAAAVKAETPARPRAPRRKTSAPS